MQYFWIRSIAVISVLGIFTTISRVATPDTEQPTFTLASDDIPGSTLTNAGMIAGYGPWHRRGVIWGLPPCGFLKTTTSWTMVMQASIVRVMTEEAQETERHP